MSKVKPYSIWMALIKNPAGEGGVFGLFVVAVLL
jgi:hypothetical protein